MNTNEKLVVGGVAVAAVALVALAWPKKEEEDPAKVTLPPVVIPPPVIGPPPIVVEPPGPPGPGGMGPLLKPNQQFEIIGGQFASKTTTLYALSFNTPTYQDWDPTLSIVANQSLALTGLDSLMQEGSQLVSELKASPAEILVIFGGWTDADRNEAATIPPGSAASPMIRTIPAAITKRLAGKKVLWVLPPWAGADPLVEQNILAAMGATMVPQLPADAVARDLNGGDAFASAEDVQNQTQAAQLVATQLHEALRVGYTAPGNAGVGEPEREHEDVGLGAAYGYVVTKDLAPSYKFAGPFGTLQAGSQIVGALAEIPGNGVQVGFGTTWLLVSGGEGAGLVAGQDVYFLGVLLPPGTWTKSAPGARGGTKYYAAKTVYPSPEFNKPWPHLKAGKQLADILGVFNGYLAVGLGGAGLDGYQAAILLPPGSWAKSGPRMSPKPYQIVG